MLTFSIIGRQQSPHCVVFLCPWRESQTFPDTFLVYKVETQHEKFTQGFSGAWESLCAVEDVSSPITDTSDGLPLPVFGLCVFTLSVPSNLLSISLRLLILLFFIIFFLLILPIWETTFRLNVCFPLAINLLLKLGDKLSEFTASLMGGCPGKRKQKWCAPRGLNTPPVESRRNPFLNRFLSRLTPSEVGNKCTWGHLLG